MYSKLKTLFLILLITLLRGSPSAYALGDDDDYRDDAYLRQPRAVLELEQILNTDLFYDQLNVIAEAILAQCPPENCIFIGIGGSPTPFLAYFEVKIPGYAWNVPLSVKALKELVLDDSILAHLDQYFPKVHPTHPTVQKDIKKVMLFDYVYTGQSARIIMNIFRDYIKRRLPGTELNFLFITAHENEKNIPAGANALSAPSDSLIISVLHDTQLKRIYRPYPNFDPTKARSISSGLNPKFFELVEKMRKHSSSQTGMGL
jgi:hypothetical protein